MGLGTNSIRWNRFVHDNLVMECDVMDWGIIQVLVGISVLILIWASGVL